MNTISGHNDHIAEPQGEREHSCPRCGEDTHARRVDDCEHCGPKSCKWCGESIEFGPSSGTFTEATDGYCARCVNEFAKTGQ